MVRPGILLCVLSVSATLCFSSCAPSDGPVAEGRRSSPVEKAATFHLWRQFRGRSEKLSETYAPTVRLLPGHEFTLSYHGFLNGDGRDKAFDVDRDALIAVIAKRIDGNPILTVTEVETLFALHKFEDLQATVGDHATEPAKPVNTPDGKLHFTIEEGDVLLRLAPPGKDLILLQMRRMGGEWRVVAEYIE